MYTAALQIDRRAENKLLRRFAITAITITAVFMIVARLISGVHWLSDIIGGVLVSTGFVMLYRFTVSETTEKNVAAE